MLPASVAAALLQQLGHRRRGDAGAASTRADRRRLSHALVAWPLPSPAAAATTTRKPPPEAWRSTKIDPATMESRRCPGLYLVGEMLDVDGRIGGFNFQWAWSSAMLLRARWLLGEVAR